MAKLKEVKDEVVEMTSDEWFDEQINKVQAELVRLDTEMKKLTGALAAYKHSKANLHSVKE